MSSKSFATPGHALLMAPVNLKIDRAKKHLMELDAEIRAFNASNPYSLFREKDPQTGDQLVRVKIHRSMPAHWSAIVGDTVHNLRSALDLLAVAAVKANGVTSKTGIAETYFPISASKAEFLSKGITKIKRASPKAIRFVKRLKPYNSGREALWRLHKLDILDKHEAIIPVAAAQTKLVLAYEMVTPGGKTVKSPPFALNPATPTFPLKDGDVLMRILPGAQQGIAPHKDNAKLVFEVAFGEGQIIDGEPVVPSLQQLIDLIERVAQIFAKHVIR